MTKCNCPICNARLVARRDQRVPKHRAKGGVWCSGGMSSIGQREFAFLNRKRSDKFNSFLEDELRSEIPLLSLPSSLLLVGSTRAEVIDHIHCPDKWAEKLAGRGVRVISDPFIDVVEVFWLPDNCYHCCPQKNF